MALARVVSVPTLLLLLIASGCAGADRKNDSTPPEFTPPIAFPVSLNMDFRIGSAGEFEAFLATQRPYLANCTVSLRSGEPPANFGVLEIAERLQQAGARVLLVPPISHRELLLADDDLAREKGVYFFVYSHDEIYPQQFGAWANQVCWHTSISRCSPVAQISLRDGALERERKSDGSEAWFAKRRRS